MEIVLKFLRKKGRKSLKKKKKNAQQGLLKKIRNVRETDVVIMTVTVIKKEIAIQIETVIVMAKDAPAEVAAIRKDDQVDRPAKI